MKVRFYSESHRSVYWNAQFQAWNSSIINDVTQRLQYQDRDGGWWYDVPHLHLVTSPIVDHRGAPAILPPFPTEWGLPPHLNQM